MFLNKNLTERTKEWHRQPRAQHPLRKWNLCTRQKALRTASPGFSLLTRTAPPALASTQDPPVHAYTRTAPPLITNYPPRAHPVSAQRISVHSSACIPGSCTHPTSLLWTQGFGPAGWPAPYPQNPSPPTGLAPAAPISYPQPLRTQWGPAPSFPTGLLLPSSPVAPLQVPVQNLLPLPGQQAPAHPGLCPWSSSLLAATPVPGWAYHPMGTEHHLSHASLAQTPPNPRAPGSSVSCSLDILPGMPKRHLQPSAHSAKLQDLLHLRNWHLYFPRAFSQNQSPHSGVCSVPRRPPPPITKSWTYSQRKPGPRGPGRQSHAGKERATGWALGMWHPPTSRPYRPTAKPDHAVSSFDTCPLCGFWVGDTVHVSPLLHRKPMPSLFSSHSWGTEHITHLHVSGTVPVRGLTSQVHSWTRHGISEQKANSGRLPADGTQMCRH